LLRWILASGCRCRQTRDERASELQLDALSRRAFRPALRSK
jgi:hypothetical protein